MDVEFPSVLFLIDNKQFAVSAKYVQSIVKLPEVTSMPNYPSHMRGIINLRGQVIQISDLRKMFGMKSVTDEISDFCDMMDQRENDHKNWLETLLESVEQNIPFSLTTDPHKCAFGVWYDNFETDSLILRDILEKFDRPHKAIHAIAEEIERFKKDGDFETAKLIIERTKNQELSEMIALFNDVKKAYAKKSQELAIILEDGGRRIGITVDKVVSVQELKEQKIEGNSSDIMNIKDQRLIKGIAERDEDDKIIVVVVEKYILKGKKELV